MTLSKNLQLGKLYHVAQVLAEKKSNKLAKNKIIYLLRWMAVAVRFLWQHLGRAVVVIFCWGNRRSNNIWIPCQFADHEPARV